MKLTLSWRHFNHMNHMALSNKSCTYFNEFAQSTQASDTIGKMSWIAACALRMLARLWYSFRAGHEVEDDDDADEEEDEFTDFSVSWVARSGWVIKACPSTPSSEAKTTSEDKIGNSRRQVR